MKIAEAIRAAVEADSKVKQFMYESPSVTNLRLDRAEFPCTVLYCIERSKVDTRLGIVTEAADCNLFFLTRADSIDFDGWKNQAKVDDMRALALSFYARLVEGGVVEVVGDELEFRTVFDKGDRLTTGVSMQFTARLKQGWCINKAEDGQ